MNKIVLSTILAVTLGAVSATAGIKFYTDANGQVFITPGVGRTELKADPKEVMEAMQAATKISANDMKAEIKAELKEEMNKQTPVFAKSSKLKFSGTHYLGFTQKNTKAMSATDRYIAANPSVAFNPSAVDPTDFKKSSSEGNFEIRRSYVQLKAYLLEDPKSYLRVTLDMTYTNKTADGEGHANIYAKYAYLYLNEVLPYTGVELGMVHRPWIDYEEHQGWWMRSISKVFVEASEAAHLTNSADLGFNFKTKTDYFTSEVGVFNGEGYHGSNKTTDNNIGDGISAEWRFTASLLGNGTKKRKPKKDSYLDASFFGQYNMDNSKNNSVDILGNNSSQTYAFYGAHAVYNMPYFLVAAQYVQAKNDNKATSAFNGDGYSINSTLRFGDEKQFSLIGRYDVWNSNTQSRIDGAGIFDLEVSQTTQNMIYGVAWQQNKNLKWLLSGQTYNAKDGREYDGDVKQDWDATMLTAEVHW